MKDWCTARLKYNKNSSTLLQSSLKRYIIVNNNAVVCSVLCAKMATLRRFTGFKMQITFSWKFLVQRWNRSKRRVDPPSLNFKHFISATKLGNTTITHDLMHSFKWKNTSICLKIFTQICSKFTFSYRTLRGGRHTQFSDMNYDVSLG